MGHGGVRVDRLLCVCPRYRMECWLMSVGVVLLGRCRGFRWIHLIGYSRRGLVDGYVCR